jgi:tetratricopeptide (TPR) repeat protein
LADQPTAIALRPPLGDQLLVASFDGTVRAWNLETGQAAFRELRHPSGIMHANYSPNGRWIGYADLMGTTYLRDSQTGDLLVPPMTHTLPGKGFWVAFRPDDRQVAVATGEDTLLWDLAPEQRPVEVLAQVLDTLTGTASDPTGQDIRRAAPDLFQADPIAVNAWHRNRLAELRANRDEPTNAWPHIQPLLAASPNDSQLLLARAEIHIARQNWSAALADIDAADGGKGIDAQVQLLRGRAYFELGETRRALEAFDDAAELSPSLWLARLHRGMAKLALGDWAGGDQDIEKALEAGSIPIPDVCALALARLANRKTKPHSYDDICRAINLKSGGTKDPNLAATIATTFACGPVQSVPPNVAVGLATRAVAFNPNRMDYRFALGLAQFRAGKTADAVANLKQAETSDQLATRLKARLVLALATTEATEARQWLEKARVDLATAEAELAQGRSLPGTAWVEIEILRRQADVRFKQ